VARAAEDDGVFHARGVVHALRKSGAVQRECDGQQQVRLHLRVGAGELVGALAHLVAVLGVQVALFIAVLRHELERPGVERVALRRALTVAGLVEQFLQSLFDLVFGTHRTHPPLSVFGCVGAVVAGRQGGCFRACGIRVRTPVDNPRFRTQIRRKFAS